MTKRREKGNGSISKRGNHFRAQITIEGRRLSTTKDTKQDCLVWIRENQNQIDNGMTYLSTKTSFEEFLLKWLDNKSLELRAGTLGDYRTYIMRDIIPIFGNKKLKDLCPAMFQQYYLKLIRENRGIPTIRYINRVIHSALTGALQNRLIQYNPTDNISISLLVKQNCQKGQINTTKNEPLKGADDDFEDMQVLDEDEVNHFLNASYSSRNKVLFHLAVSTGMRVGELLALKWKDLEFHDNFTLIRVKRSVRHIPKVGVVFNPPKTKAGKREIKVGKKVTDLLLKQNQYVTNLKSHYDSQYQEEMRQAKEAAEVENHWSDNDLVFPSAVGTVQEITNLRKDFLQVLTKAGVKEIRFHDIRHTAISLMLSHGIPVLVVSKIAGHSKTSITLDTYGHMIKSAMDEAVQLMDDMISPMPIELSVYGKSMDDDTE